MAGYARAWWGMQTWAQAQTIWYAQNGFGNAVCWSPDKAIFVAVGDNNSVLTSPDGVNWTPQTGTGASNTSWQGVCWGGGQFVATGNVGFVPYIMTSPDGINWTAQTVSGFGFTGAALCGVAWGNGVYVTVGWSYNLIGGTASLMASSSDGVVWTPIGYNNAYLSYPAWIPALNEFLAVGQNLKIYSSTTGTSWTGNTSPDYYLDNICGNGTIALVVSAADSVSITSTDGTTWSAGSNLPPTGPIRLNPFGCCWSGDASMFAAVGTGACTSPDGTTWSGFESGAVLNQLSVCWSPALKLFCSVGPTQSMIRPTAV